MGVETFYSELFDRLVVRRDARLRVDILMIDYGGVVSAAGGKLAHRPDADPVPRPQSNTASYC